MCEDSRTISLGFTDEMFPEGLHMCYFYTDEEECQSFMAQFINSGLNADDRIGYFTRHIPPSDLIGRLESMGVDIPAEENNGRISICSAEQAYYPDGVFDPDKMIEQLHAYYADSMEKGFSGARLTGEAEWALQDIPGADRWIEYEGKVNVALKTSPATIICQYNTNLFDGATIMEALRVHPLVITNGQVVRNPFYAIPDNMDT
jgi:hypothetical protein